MKTRDTSPAFPVIGRMLLATALLLTCLLALLAYALLGHGQTVQSHHSKSKSAELAYLMADARTVVAAISYLLEPETTTPLSGSLYTAQVQNSQILVGQTSNRVGSNEWSRALTNHPSPG